MLDLPTNAVSGMPGAGEGSAGAANDANDANDAGVSYDPAVVSRSIHLSTAITDAGHIVGVESMAAMDVDVLPPGDSISSPPTLQQDTEGAGEISEKKEASGFAVPAPRPKRKQPSQRVDEPDKSGAGNKIAPNNSNTNSSKKGDSESISKKPFRGVDSAEVIQPQLLSSSSKSSVQASAAYFDYRSVLLRKYRTHLAAYFDGHHDQFPELSIKPSPLPDEIEDLELLRRAVRLTYHTYGPFCSLLMNILSSSRSIIG
jgi:hypothetical protein